LRETGLPFLGVTVTFNLHIPTLIPLTDTPDALQIFTDDPATVNRTLDDEATVNFANTAIDLALVDLFTFKTSTGKVLATVVVVVTATVVVVGSTIAGAAMGVPFTVFDLSESP
jgi:hypothetical protein